MAAVPIVVPADPPMPITPNTRPSACARRIHTAAPAAAALTAFPRSPAAASACASYPAAEKIASRGTSALAVGGPTQPTSTSCAHAAAGEQLAEIRRFASLGVERRNDVHRRLRCAAGFNRVMHHTGLAHGFIVARFERASAPVQDTPNRRARKNRSRENEPIDGARLSSRTPTTSL